MQKVKVFIVKETPLLTSPDICSAIRDETAARAWGEKHGYPQVYFNHHKQRVWADKPSIRVDSQAKQIEQKSRRLVELAETGGALLEYLLLIALVLGITCLLGWLLGWPW